jgi:drug/metabolite transporter (DMT)-like permease
MFLLVALSSYFLSAFTIILDKFLLGSKRISSAPVYSFYIGVFGMFVLAFIPFGLAIPSTFQLFLSFLSGALFSFGILALYFAIQKGEASRVSPIVGAMIPIVTYSLSFIFSIEKLNNIQVLGIMLLILGGLLISFDLPLKINKRKFVAGFFPSLLSGFLLALSYFGFKFVYEEQNFINGFIWTRFGCFLGVAGYLLIPKWRKQIYLSLKNFRKPERHHYHTGIIFISNKIMGGIASILLNFAIALGSVTLVNSLVSSQYVFILFLAYFAHKKYPFVFEEKLYFWDWVQKIGAIFLIGAGVFLIY